MSVGLGVVLLVIGLILVTHAVSLPASWEAHISHHWLGWILIWIGILGIVIGLVETWMWRRRGRTYVDRRDRPDVF